MESALKTGGLDTYAKLAAASEVAIRSALTAAGINLALAGSLNTWANQADFAAKGDMDGLKALQETLTGGRKSNS